MKIVIIGDGKVGYTLAQALSQEGHDIVVIDNDRQVLDQTIDRLDVMCIEGNGASTVIQRQAGVGASELMIAVTSSDELNLMCCMVAKKLGCQRTIARIRNPEYTEAAYLMRDDLGLSMTVNPEREAAMEIFKLLQFPSFLKRDSFAKGRAEIVELPVRHGSRLAGVMLQQLYNTLKVRVLVCAVARGNEVYIPDGSFILKEGDHIYVTAPTNTLVSMVKALDMETNKIRYVMIVGGSHIAFYLSKMLLSAGVNVKMIERQRERCEKLSQTLHDATIINADGTVFATLTSEGLAETDAVVTLTNIDEQNLIISMYANHVHVPKVVTKINRIEYREIMHDTGAECTISPRLLTSNDILRYVRAMQNRREDGVITLHRLVNEQVEALEFRVSAATAYKGVMLKDIPLKKDLRVAIISHRSEVVVPRGDSCFVEGDTVMIVTSAKQHFSSLNDIFTTLHGGLGA